MARGRELYVAGWRKSVFIEYYFVNDNSKCTEECVPSPDPNRMYSTILRLYGMILYICV